MLKTLKTILYHFYWTKVKDQYSQKFSPETKEPTEENSLLTSRLVDKKIKNVSKFITDFLILKTSLSFMKKQLFIFQYCTIAIISCKSDQKKST